MTRKISENKEAEAEDEEEFRSDNVKNKAPLLRSTNKLSLSTAREKPPSTASYQMWPLFVTETKDELDNSSYIPSKPYHASTPRPASSHSTGLERDISDNGKREFTGG